MPSVHVLIPEPEPSRTRRARRQSFRRRGACFATAALSLPLCAFPASAVVMPAASHVHAAAGGAAAAPAAQQAADTIWNDARSLALVEQARERRRQPLADTALRNYQGHAEGVVYFYLDRRDVDERILVRTDQVALEVLWAQPDRTKQRIVGLRNESSLPNRMFYHLDHLTVVQNGFGDVMRMGDGDEVRDVPHPAAPGSGSIYDFRLTDSLELRLPGAVGPIKAYAIDVRPKRTDESAFVGRIFVDHMTGDIVRMTFTFTPVSYVDRRLDYINISLDNSLWNGRYWLPWEQAVEIRRQVPELDFVVTSVIQARFRVREYTFNQDLPESLFWGYPVVTVPRAQREAFEFDRELYADLHNAGLAPPPELQEIRLRAADLIRQRALSGLPRLRLSLPSASSALRFNRAEGLYLGWGSSFTPDVSTRLEVLAGFAFGPARPLLSFGMRRSTGESSRLRTRLFTNELRDVGLHPGMPGALNTLASLWGDDYFDPFTASGARIGLAHSPSALWVIDLELAAEGHRPAARQVMPLFGESAFRPVRPTDRGTLYGGTFAVERRVRDVAGMSWSGTAALEGGSFNGAGFARPVVQLALRRGSADRRSAAELHAHTGLALGAPPTQRLFLVGGRNTLPGYAYRSFGGDVFALIGVEASRDLAFPFVRGRVRMDAGWTDVLDDDAGLPPGWAVTTTAGIRTSVSAGVGLVYDILRIDLARGLNRAGEWQLLFSVEPRIWPWL